MRVAWSKVCRQTAMMCVLAGVSLSASAGTFFTRCYSDVTDCGKEVRDLVTDKFTSRYPSAKFQLVLIASFDRYSNGGGVGFAVAGVVPVPTKRFIATTRIIGRAMTVANQRSKTIDVMRSAVDELMTACSNDPGCNVHD